MGLLPQGEDVEKTVYRWGFYSFAENRIIHSKSYEHTYRLIIKKDVAYYNDVISNPFSGKEYGQVLGVKKFISNNFSKVIVSRDGALFLGKFNSNEKIYDFDKLDIENEKYTESFLSPDGKYLVVSKEIGNYELFDITSNQKTTFFRGNFLEFTTDGKLIYEEDGSRIARIIDPVTLQEIIPQNYKYYRFHSPDGTLHASLAKFSKQKSLITGEYLSDDDLKKYPSSGSFQFFPGKEEDERRENLYSKNTKYFHNLGIYEPQQIRKDHILKTDYFITITSETGASCDILLPENLEYYNYSAFSFDNTYFAFVGKGSMSGIVKFFEISETHNGNFTIKENTAFSTKNASWLCSFSKSGFFATYDSNPHTYLISIDELEAINTAIKNNEQLGPRYQNNLYHLFRNLKDNTIVKSKKIFNKNFLSFSPSGKYMALSEQGYNPISLGGTGHQSSSALHIYDLDKQEIVNAYDDHGEEIKYDKKKKIAYVYFSADEKQVMTLSTDGVVVIRDVSEDRH